MAELVDVPDSKSGVPRDVRVRAPPSAQFFWLLLETHDVFKANVAELVDVPDLKSGVPRDVRVRAPPLAFFF